MQCCYYRRSRSWQKFLGQFDRWDEHGGSILRCWGMYKHNQYARDLDSEQDVEGKAFRYSWLVQFTALRSYY
jgi:hypothetical protein